MNELCKMELTLKEDMKTAMKQKDAIALSTIRMVNAAILSKKHESNHPDTLKDDDVQKIILKEIKMREDSIKEYEKVNAKDAILLVEKEIHVLKKYAPQFMEDHELKVVISNIIHETEESLHRKVEKKDFGMIMKAVMAKVKGKAEGKKVNHFVNEAICR